MTGNTFRHRPWPLGLANRLAGSLRLDQRVRLDPDELVSCVGAADLGDGDWRDRLERLCVALNEQARLNLVGRLSARSHLLQLLRNRLTLAQARAQDPQISAGSIAAPLFITGLPRTGSTLLHGLLSQDPALATPLTWEVMLPPRRSGFSRDPNATNVARPQVGGIAAEAAPTGDKRHIRKTEQMLAWVHRLAPAFRTIHPIGALLPQECIAITAHAFASVEFHTTFNVPGYQGWLDRSDHIDAFRLHRTFVQHLQRYRQASQWVFKAPAHIHALPAIVATYPEARFVFTDRDPAQVVASIASHGVVLRNAFSDCVDNEAVAREWMHWWADGKKAAEQFRKTTTSTVLDLHYQTLIADPIAAVASLYEQLGWHWNNELAQRMQAFLDENQQDKYGRHRYSLAQFGLHERDVEQAFAATK